MAYGNFKKKKSSPKARALKYGYRSGLEEKVAVELKEHFGYEVPFETVKLDFEQPKMELKEVYKQIKLNKEGE